MTDSMDLVDRLISDWRGERPDLDTRAMAVVGRLIQLGADLRASASDALAPHGLSYTDFDILATLRRSGTPFRLTPTELRDSVLLTSGAMTTALGRLVARRLVEREADVTDRRVKFVRLTSAGADLVDSAVSDRFAEAERAILALDPAEREALEGLLRKLTGPVEKAR